MLGQGRLKEADKLLRSALSLRAKSYGKDHWLVATALNNLGTLLTRRERWEEAEKAIRQVRVRSLHCCSCFGCGVNAAMDPTWSIYTANAP